MKNTKQEIQRLIERKRATMLEDAKRYGMHSKEVQEKSEELDLLIINYMRKDKE
ncbi:aspartyl-phosphate phosphatase Spo0E family protein [Paucisalibacillus globulus]|uniref:aspartyl-phosphate phosphatase Spo0E family protein n=1 Tax=Paucisalibacillus globulus TaxID=351095 RepID=UPI000BB6DBA1|nr:aspartyl-phosphate phosphatase Spo0E family protein [Paucisalibacillus globulus]